MTDPISFDPTVAETGPVLRTTASLAQCLDDWADVLGRALRPPPPRDWRSDTGYGLIDVYVEAAGLPADHRPHINVLHAQFIGMSDQWYRRSEAGFRSVPAIFVHNEPDKTHLERVFCGRKRVLVAPHPFHYIVRHYEAAAAGLSREGSVFFLPHTIGQPTPRVPIGLVIRRLQQLPSEYHPIEVCLHANDVSEQLIDAFKNFGFNVLSAGYRHDPVFLHRFYWLSRRRRYAITVDHGTHVWLSTLAGCQIVMLRDVPDMIWIPANNSLDWLVTPRPHYWPLLDAISSPMIDQVLFKGLIWRLTGGDHWLTSKELRLLFESAGDWYRDWRGPDGRLCVPPRMWAPVEPLMRRMHSVRVAAANRLSGRRGQWQPMCADLPAKLMAYERACQQAECAETQCLSDEPQTDRAPRGATG